jgi:Tol biopolymer transport system component
MRISFVEDEMNVLKAWAKWSGVVIGLGLSVSSAAAGTTERVSVSSAGAQGNRATFDPAISSDGRFVVFASRASNLVPGDTNHRADIFVHDRTTGTTERVSVSGAGAEGNGGSRYPSISSDGHFVVFASRASNLVPGDTNHRMDIFLHDRTTGATERVSLTQTGGQAQGHSGWAAISANGHQIAFVSHANNLVSGDTNGRTDVFVRDRILSTTRRVSVSGTGA